MRASTTECYSSFISTNIKVDMCYLLASITTINSRDNILIWKVSHKNYSPITKIHIGQIHRRPTRPPNPHRLVSNTVPMPIHVQLDHPGRSPLMTDKSDDRPSTRQHHKRTWSTIHWECRSNESSLNETVCPFSGAAVCRWLSRSS